MHSYFPITYFFSSYTGWCLDGAQPPAAHSNQKRPWYPKHPNKQLKQPKELMPDVKY